MASTYFDGATDIQPVDGLQTLYLMNPPYAPPPPQQSNFIFLNSPLINSQHLVSIPLQQDSIDFHSQMGWSSFPAQQGLSLSLSATENDGGVNGVVGSNKYLKATQQLLDEVVNVKTEQIIGRGETAVSDSEKETNDNLECGGGQTGGGGRGDLTAAERQEVQMKKAKLENMLTEVEQRYRKYQQQMQILVSNFESMAGFRSARAYTDLALKIISKQFRCLRDAISDRIRATSNRLGEKEDADGLDAEQGKKCAGYRLRCVGHQPRQQRSLQQPGMIMQVHNAWRPQRGLPERAVSLLRAWLFEHFLHPYPKDSDKHMLAKQTGHTRNQVSNWFINARVRLWKPMVEEMYLEETKQQDHNNGDKDKTSKSESSEQSPHSSNSHQPNSSTPRSDQNVGLYSVQDYGMIKNHSDEPILQKRLKKAREDNSLNQNTISNQISMEINEMRSDELRNRELLMKLMDQGRGFGGYPIEEIAQFDRHKQFTSNFERNGGSVSLTLGLPHCENLSDESIPSGSNYFSLDNNSSNPSAINNPNGYESFNIQNRTRLTDQLLPDYVPLEL